MGAMTVLWSFLGVLKHLLAPPLRCPCLLRLKKIIILHLFLGVPAATVGGTGTPWHTRGYAPDLHSYDFHCSALKLLQRFFPPKYDQKHCKPVNSDLQAKTAV